MLARPRKKKRPGAPETAALAWSIQYIGPGLHAWGAVLVRQSPACVSAISHIACPTHPAALTLQICDGRDFISTLGTLDTPSYLSLHAGPPTGLTPLMSGWADLNQVFGVCERGVHQHSSAAAPVSPQATTSTGISTEYRRKQLSVVGVLHIDKRALHQPKTTELHKGRHLYPWPLFQFHDKYHI